MITISVAEKWQRYDTLSKGRQWLFNDIEAGEILMSIFQKYQLSEGKYTPYALTFGDVVLGFEEMTKLPDLLVERAKIPQDKAILVAQDLIAFITEHTGGDVKQATDKKETLPQTEKPALTETEEVGAINKQPDPAETPFIPSYAQPFTGQDTGPRYTDDPYRIPPK